MPGARTSERVVIGRLVGEAGDQLQVTGGDITLNKSACRRKVCAAPRRSNNSRLTLAWRSSRLLPRRSRLGFHERGNSSALACPAAAARTERVASRPRLAGERQSIVSLRLTRLRARRAGACSETVFFRLVEPGFFDTSTRNSTSAKPAGAEPPQAAAPRSSVAGSGGPTQGRARSSGPWCGKVLPLPEGVV